MKRIGLLGGMSWESTVTYYQILNREAQKRCGGVASADILLRSFDFAEIEVLQSSGDWDALTAILADAGRALAAGGAEVLAICTNTMHLMADEVQAAAGIPLVHICDATAAAVSAAGLKRVALLGTAFTMEQAFYRDRLAAGGLEVMVPDGPDRAEIHRIIYEELVCGRIEPASRTRLCGIIASLAATGAEGVILGCTELPLLIRAADAPVPVFDTSTLHAMAIADLAFG